MRLTWGLMVALMVATGVSAEDAPAARSVMLPIDAIVETSGGLARGAMIAECGAGGTSLRFSLSGLVPGGSYSLWMFVFDTSRDNSTPADAVAAGALGRGDGRSHQFRANAAGQAELSLLQPSGPLSAFGAVRGCLLDNAQWRVIGGYHPRRVTAGTLMPAPGEIVEHFGVRSTAPAALSTN